VAKDTSGAAAATAIDKPGAGANSMNSPKSGRRATTNAPSFDEPRVWLGILQDWILSARKAGLTVDLYDLRPQEDACGVIISGVFFCRECGNFSRGNACGYGCEHGVVAAKPLPQVVATDI
jgi:hypothetical protein